jgi:hypothetical protein
LLHELVDRSFEGKHVNGFLVQSVDLFVGLKFQTSKLKIYSLASAIVSSVHIADTEDLGLSDRTILYSQVIECIKQSAVSKDTQSAVDRSNKIEISLAANKDTLHQASSQKRVTPLNPSSDASGANEPSDEDSFNDACSGGGLVGLWKSVMSSNSVVKLSVETVREFQRQYLRGGPDWFVRTLIEVTFAKIEWTFRTSF